MVHCLIRFREERLIYRSCEMPELETSLEEAENRLAGNHTHDVVFEDDWHLVNVLILHPLQDSQRRLIRRGGMNFLKRQHDRLNRSVVPFAARNRPRRRKGDQTYGRFPGDRNVAAVAGAQHFMNVFLN